MIREKQGDRSPHRLLESASLLVINSLEKVFYRWGHFVASHPYAVIVCALVATAACGTGFLNFTSMADVQKLYLPPDHIYLQGRHYIQSLAVPSASFN